MFSDCYLAKRDEELTTWHPFKSLPETRAQSKSCLIGGVPWLIGGNEFMHGHAHLLILEKTSLYYDKDTDQWNFGPELPNKLRQHAFVAISDTEALIIGGEAIFTENPFSSAYQNAVHKLDTVANTITPYAHDLPDTLYYADAVKVTLSGGQEAVLTVGGSRTTSYKSVLPNGVWDDVPAMAPSSATMYNVVCERFESHGGKAICAFTRMTGVDPYDLVHEFDPNGPPFWIQMPYKMLSGSGRTQSVVYTHVKRICC